AGVAARVVLAIGAVLIYNLTESPADAGLKAIATAVKKERRTKPVVSGLPYSPYASALRGGGGTDDLAFDNAQNKLKFALDESAAPAGRLNLARLYLARAEGGDAQQALAILQALAASRDAASGMPSPQILNDTGVALYGLGRYAEAVDYFSRALAAEPNMKEALFNKAVAEQQIDRQAARQDYQKFIDSASDQRWIEEARSRLKDTQ